MHGRAKHSRYGGIEFGGSLSSFSSLLLLLLLFLDRELRELRPVRHEAPREADPPRVTPRRLVGGRPEDVDVGRRRLRLLIRTHPCAVALALQLVRRLGLERRAQPQRRGHRSLRARVLEVVERGLHEGVDFRRDVHEEAIVQRAHEYARSAVQHHRPAPELESRHALLRRASGRLLLLMLRRSEIGRLRGDGVSHRRHRGRDFKRAKRRVLELHLHAPHELAGFAEDVPPQPPAEEPPHRLGRDVCQRMANYAGVLAPKIETRVAKEPQQCIRNPRGVEDPGHGLHKWAGLRWEGGIRLPKNSSRRSKHDGAAADAGDEKRVALIARRHRPRRRAHQHDLVGQDQAEHAVTVVQIFAGEVAQVDEEHGTGDEPPGVPNPHDNVRSACVLEVER
mmetsp:Transcript_25364/g.83396  ORF Transcript_25364/g.83396 Transcript_25364/m.83396 type:complete len:394 (-) Transcript_25364:391-1572(-)